jgi:hypothetical protein
MSVERTIHSKRQKILLSNLEIIIDEEYEIRRNNFERPNASAFIYH